MRVSGIAAAMGAVFVAMAAQPASAQYIHLKDFPKIFGVYAVAGGCAKSPRLAVNAGGILLEAAGKRTLYANPEIELGFGGREDTNVTVALRGPDEGLIIAFAEDGSFAYTLGGEHLTPGEAALDAVTGEAAGNTGMVHCGAPRPKAAATPEPEEPKMRTVAAPTVDAIAAQGYTTDPGFMAAFGAALGPLKKEWWLTEFEGPGDSKIVTIAGVRYFEVTGCKPHDCGDNTMLVLYRPAPRTLYGAVRLHAGAPVLIGNPPPAMAVQVRKLLVKEWTPQ